MKNRSLTQLIVGILILVSLISPLTAAQNSPKIKLNYKAEAKSGQLKLGDIAQIEAQQQLAAKLAAVSLGQAPLPGYTRVIKRKYIIAALQRAGFDHNQLRTQIPKQVRVSTPHQVLDNERLKRAVKSYIDDNLPSDVEDVEVKLGRLQQEVKLPLGQIRLEVGSSYDRNLLGRTSLPVNIYVDDKLARKKYVTAEITAYQKVLVAKKLIKRHQALTKELFKWERRPLNKLYGNQPFTKLEKLHKYRLERTINGGQILTTRLIEIPPLVKRRDKVRIIARVSRIEVSTVGIALESGTKGEIIEVENLKSGQKLMAKVINKNTVQVIL